MISEQDMDITTRFCSIAKLWLLSLFPILSTNRIPIESGGMFFHYERIISLLAVSFSRYSINLPGESAFQRLIFSGLLGFFAYQRVDYWILVSLHLCTYGQGVFRFIRKILMIDYEEKNVKGVQNPYKETTKKRSHCIELSQLVITTILAHVAIVYLVYSFFNWDSKYSLLQSRIYQQIQSSRIFDHIASHVKKTLAYLVPITEVYSAYDTLLEFVDSNVLHKQMSHLLFVTFHIQIGLSFLGINFLSNEQERKNSLIRLEDLVPADRRNKRSTVPKIENTASGNELNSETRDPSKKFRKNAGPFIFFVAIPYMLQLIFYGGVNMYAYHCFKDDLHRTIRLYSLFDSDNRFVTTASAGKNYRSPAAYASNIETVVSTVYDLINNKIFSLPKLLLLPRIISNQPSLLVKIFPFVILSDYIKALISSTLTSEVERIGVKVKDLESIRTKVEEFDLKNSDLIQRSGSGSLAFTESRWITLTEEIHDLSTRASLMRRSRLYFSWLQRNFVMLTMVDCALAKLIGYGKIIAKDIFIYQRSIEDAIDLLLMRSRAESELASMASSIVTLKELKATWSENENRNLLKCFLINDNDPPAEYLEIKNLTYSRGSTTVQIDNFVLEPNIYAITGANGCGKSTLFRILLSCDTNSKSIDLVSSIAIKKMGSIGMPSSDVVEITQDFYWPLFTKPINWIYMMQLESDIPYSKKRESMITSVVEHLHSLNFYQDTNAVNKNESATSSSLRSDLTEVKEDWFSNLSGGQKSKLELVRKVFLAKECPKVLLIDEAFAPLDPDSKTLVIKKLKTFCSNSFVLVIYHADANVDDLEEDNGGKSCIPSNNFFNKNIHIEGGVVSLRNLC